MQDIFTKPQFYQEGASASDVRQGYNGDCWFLSAVCAISNKQHLIDKCCVARDEAVGVYGFVFYRDGEWFFTIIDDKLYLRAADWWETDDYGKQTFNETSDSQEAERKYRESFQRGSRALYFAQCREENETWLPLLEKAFAKAHGDYGAIDGGFAGEAIEDLTGGVTTELYSTDILDKEAFWNEEIKQVNKEFLFSCATGSYDHWMPWMESSPDDRGGIVSSHAYSIMDAVERKGHRLLKVRNPWGKDCWKGAWSDGSEQWTGEWLQELDHKFGDDGQFWISYEDLLDKFNRFERTRLFDDSWTITQQWTTVDVPYSADYNDVKFTITLKKESPVVIVLSQLDDRYFKGMGGEYRYQLHFRLDREGEDDYIVRSHGNYNMNRSVSTDLDLEPGTYSVLMKIRAWRYKGFDWGIPEKTIRNVANSRPNKLIQIGLSYDLAFAKGEVRETEEEKEYRLKIEQQKKAAAKKKQRQEVSELQKKKYERTKRERARQKRHDQKREIYRQKKADKEKSAAGDVQSQAGGEASTVAAGVEGEVEKQAAAGAEQDKSGNDPVDAQTMPTPPADTEPPIAVNGLEDTSTAEKQEASKPSEDPKDSSKASAAENGTSAKATETSNKADQFQKGLDAIPAVTVNGDQALSVPGAASLAPPSVAASAVDPDEFYDSDASFHSSVDSVLDLAEETPAVDEQPAAADDADDDDEDAEFEGNPWNAVCAVGLRVFSKDDGCSINVVRPRPTADDSLEVDDVSRGVSGDKVNGENGETAENAENAKKDDLKVEVSEEVQTGIPVDIEKDGNKAG